MFLLDTNVVSELRKKANANKKVAGWASGETVSRLFLSVVSILEVELGARLAARKDAATAAHLRDWIDNFLLVEFDGRILPIDTEVALRCAALHVPDPCPERDAMIAATALVHDLTVVTRNVRDFSVAGVRLFNPWESA